jgi:hypothetical protein
LTDIQFVDYVTSKNGMQSSICLLKYKLPSFKSRDFLIAYSTKYIDSNTCMLIGKNVEHKKVPHDPKSIRGAMHFCLIIETKLLMNICKVSFISFIDLKGTVSQNFYNQALRKRTLFLIPKLNEIILERKSRNETRPKNHFRILDTFDQCSKIESEESKSKIKLALLNVLFSHLAKGSEDIVLEDNISTLIGNPLVKRGFKIFCEKEWSIENLLLFDEIEGIQKLKTNSQKISKIKEICYVYFSKESELEVNVDYLTREKIMKNLSEINEEKNLDTFFEDLENIIKRNLRDSMNRYLFSDEFKELKVQIERKRLSTTK